MDPSRMQEDEEGLYPSFEHQTIYDAPANFLGQLLDGEASWAAFRGTFLQPERLSPLERHNARERLKESAGGTAPGNFLIDLATNPFVWALFAFHPAGAKAVKAGKRIFGNTRDGTVGKRFVGYVKDKKGMLTTLLDGMGLLSLRQKVEDTPLTAIMSASANSKLAATARWESDSGLMVAQEKLLERIERTFGLKAGSLNSIDPEAAPNAVANIGGRTVSLGDHLKDVNRVIWLRLSGADRDRETLRPVLEKTWMARARRVNPTTGDVEERNVQLFGEHAKEVTDRLAAANKALADDSEKVRDAIRGSMPKVEVMVGGDAWEIDTLPAPVPDGYSSEARRLVLAKVADVKDVPSRVGPDAIRFGETQTIQKALADSHLVDRAIADYGLDEIIAAKRKALTLVRNDLFLDKDGQISETKLTRLWRWVSEGKALDPSAPVDEEDLARLSIAESMFGRKMLDRIRRGEMTEAEWMDGSKRMLKAQLDNDEWYFPRNTTSMLGVSGEIIPEEEAIARNRARKWTGGSFAQLRTDDDLHMSPEDLDGFRKFASDPKTLRNLDEAKTRARNAWQDAIGRGEALPVTTADANRGMYTHLRRASRDYALAVEDLADDERRSYLDLRPTQADVGEKPLPKLGMPKAVPGTKEGDAKTQAFDASQWPTYSEGGKTFLSDKVEERLPAGGVTRFDLLKVMVGKDGVIDPRHAEFAREIVMPRMMGETPIRSLFLWEGIRKAKGAARIMADSAPLVALERGGGVAGNWVKAMRDWGTSNTMLTQGSQLSGSVAKWLYASHLGYNPGSVILNLTQPFLHGAAWMGGTNVVKAYPKAMQALGGYMADRVKYGRTMRPSERQALFAKHFDFGQEGHSVLPLLGITDDLLDQLDGVAVSHMGRRKQGPVGWAMTDLPLIPFKMSERLNRLVTARGVESLYVSKHGAGAWKDPKVRTRMLSDMESMVQRTQFGPGVLDQPELFLKQLDSPVMRMFLSFPVRSATALLETGQGVLQRGERGVAVDALRMMGVSAVIYEAGKQFLGADLTRGLAAESLGSLVGGERFVQEQNLAVPAPPALDIAYGLARGVALGDAEALRSTLPRLVPGGIALSRMMGTAPPMPQPLGSLQKQKVDWAAMSPDGQVPVYDADGQLVKWAYPGDVVLRAMGVDMGKWNDSAKLTRWLVSNRERIVDYRRRYVQAVLAGEMGRANSIRDEYQTSYGLPLTVTREQWDKAVQVRERPVMERSYEMVPKDMRAAFAPALASRRGALGVPSEEEGSVVQALARPASQRFDDRPSPFSGFEVPEGY